MSVADAAGPRVALIADSLEGGAGRAAGRLFRALRELGVSVDLLHFYGELADIDTICLDGRSKRPPFERALKNVSRGAADSLRRKRHYESLKQALLEKDYALLHLHNLHASGVANADLEVLTAGEKVLWTLHDEYAFRGRPFPEEDETEPPPVPPELFSIGQLAFTGPSQWICRQAEEALEGRAPVHHVPLGLDRAEFTALDSEECRRTLELDPEMLWLGFAGGNDLRKGGDLLLAASRCFPAESKVGLLAWGRPLPEGEHGFAEVRQLPFFKDSGELNRAYAACDLMLVPSRQDNFPLVVLESLACGTPVAASTRGGASEAIEPGVNGISLPIEPAAMAEALAQVLDREKLAVMRAAARRSFEERYTSELEAHRVLALYEAMTGQWLEPA